MVAGIGDNDGAGGIDRHAARIGEGGNVAQPVRAADQVTPAVPATVLTTRLVTAIFRIVWFEVSAT